MAAQGNAKKVGKNALALEDQELRTLRIPAPGHRGFLSPSKNSFLPTLQEQQGRQVGKEANGRKQRVEITHTADVEEHVKEGEGGEVNILVHLDAGSLEGIKQQITRHGGSVSLDQFVEVIVSQLPQMEGEEQVDQTMHVIALFRQIDVHGTGELTWEEVSNFLIEQGMRGGEEFTVDNIKRYETSPTMDTSKHEDVVEKLLYFEQIDTLVAMSHNSRKFRLYDPRKCTIKHEVQGHRGTVINCCFIDDYHQIASTGADSAICFWDAANLQLKSRIATKDVQRCLAYNPQVDQGCLFAGSTDGSLTRWSMSNLSVQETKKGGAMGAHKKAINDLLMINDINLLASASSDSTILMWDCQLMKPKKTLKGHKKGVYSLAYSTDYHCVLSAGLDQEALVWNPYVERVPIFRLKGHSHALTGVAIVPGTAQILTADVAGSFRLWDMRNFRCVQAFGGTEQLQDLNTFCTMPPHKRLAAGSSKIFMYDYQEEWGGENVTDVAGVTDALYHPDLTSFYTVSKRSIKVWDSRAKLSKVLRDVARNEITAVCFADKGRKIYCGDSRGEICAHTLLSGNRLRHFSSHKVDISCLCVWPGTNRLISAAWDGTLKVHADEAPALLKAEFQAHTDGISCVAISPENMLLASGGIDFQVVLYHLKSLKVEITIPRDKFKSEISAMSWLHKDCILAVGDRGGRISLWGVGKGETVWTCYYDFENVGSQQDPSMGPISALQWVPSEGQDQYMVTSDTKGRLRSWNLGKFVQGLYKREEERSGASLGVFLTAADDYATKEKKTQHVLDVDVGAHNEAILGLRVISHPAAVLSCGLDKRVRLWALPTLATCGGLLQRRDQQFQFELGLGGRAAAIEEARKVLRRITVTPHVPTLDDVRGAGLDSAPIIHGRAKEPKRTSDAWVSALSPQLQKSYLEGRDPYHEEVFSEFLKQMNEADSERVDMRLSRHASDRVISKLRQRQKPLSQPEADAARMLAKAMFNAGDDQGIYGAMADNLQPRVRGSRRGKTR